MPRRDSRFPSRINVYISIDLRERLERAAKSCDVAPGTLAREAMEHGIQAAIDQARREAARRAAITAAKPARQPHRKGAET